MANSLYFPNFEDFSDQFEHNPPPDPYYPEPYAFWGPPTPSNNTPTTQASQRTAIPYHGVSPDHFYQDSPVSQLPRQSSPPRFSQRTPPTTATRLPHTPSPQPTVVPWAPSPPEASPNSLAAERLFQDFDFGPPLLPQPLQHPSPTYHAPRRIPRDHHQHHHHGPQVVRFDERQLAMDAEQTGTRARAATREELDMTGGQVTPGIDETPFIHAALDAITRDDGANPRLPSGDSEFDTQKPSRTVAHQSHLGDYHESHDDDNSGSAPAPFVPTQQPGPPYPGPPDEMMPNELDPAEVHAAPTISSSSSSEIIYQKIRPKIGDPLNRIEVRNDVIKGDERLARRCPPQDYKPWILRLPSFILIMTLCILMIAGLIFCAIHSKRSKGLLDYAGTINSGQYFLFRLLPQILGAILFLYGQAMVLTTFRVLPFARMASEDPKLRHGAIFQYLYPKSFLWPHMVGPPQIKLVIFLMWLMNFTIPLQSTLFTVIHNDQWTWATVQGSAYALVALYIIFLAALIILWGFWHGTVTGMLWDFRCIADMLPMLHFSNITHSYEGSQLIPDRRRLRWKLRRRLDDRIGYWQNENTATTPRDAYSGRYWWGMGVSTELEHKELAKEGKKAEKQAKDGAVASNRDLDMPIPAEASRLRYGYLPWCMRDTQIIYFVVAGLVTVVALFVVSFNAKTRLSNGFKPELDATPDKNAFSSANFLYSFIPSVLGQILFLLFQALELSYRQLAPWAEMGKMDGGLATRTVLVDYAACFPFEASFKAVRNQHYRVAFIDFLASVFIFMPILAGGLFMALNVRRGDEGLPDQVRMFPSVAVFGVLLLLLCLFVAGLVAMIPNRAKYRLPHAITCLAEMITFFANDELLHDPAFRFPRTRDDMLARLGVLGSDDPADQTRWRLGTGPSDDDAALGVRRVRKFTEKKAGMSRANRSGSRGSRGRPLVQQTPVI